MATPPARRVGLSHRHAPGHLLKSIKPNTETTTTAKTAAKPESKPRGGRPQLKVPEPDPDDISAPPLASSDSEDDGIAGNAEAGLESDLQPQSLGDSSDSDGPPRGAISSTNFISLGQKGERKGRRTKGRVTKAASHHSVESDGLQPGARKRKRPSDTSNDKGKSKKNAIAEPESAVPPSSSGSHLTNGHGFTRKAKVKATFGKKVSNSQESRKSRASEESSSANFRPPPEFNNDTPRKSHKFLVPDKDTFSSPIKTVPPRRLDFQRDSDSDTDDDTAVFSQPRSNTDDVDVVVKRKPRAKQKVTPLLPNKRNTASKEKKEATPESPPSPRAKFVMPAQLSDFKPPKTTSAGSMDNDDLSDGSSSTLSSLGPLFPDKDGEEDDDAEALCPWCGATVDVKQLEEFSKGKRLNVWMQTEFCKAHKKKSAMATWKSRSYPQVKWARLEKRFKNHQERLLSIINGEESHYRTVLADKIELGQARSMKKEKNLNPGYYGPRGFNIMCDYLVKEFSDMLKKKAIHDKVIAGRGPAAFIQSVLVAELGVQLIMEDMHVSMEEARGILEESKALGELVHAEI
ncbi:RTC4-like domain-containing protein [Trichoderma ceciliae]